MNAPCLGNKFGHNFPYTGARCLACGVPQKDLNNPAQEKNNVLSFRLKESSPKLHSPAHLLADEITQAFSEKKQFGMYLGVINRLGVIRARRMFQELQASEHSIASKRKLFMWQAKQEYKTIKK